MQANGQGAMTPPTQRATFVRSWAFGTCRKITCAATGNNSSQDTMQSISERGTDERGACLARQVIQGVRSGGAPAQANWDVAASGQLPRALCPRDERAGDGAGAAGSHHAQASGWRGFVAAGASSPERPHDGGDRLAHQRHDSVFDRRFSERFQHAHGLRVSAVVRRATGSDAERQGWHEDDGELPACLRRSAAADSKPVRGGDLVRRGLRAAKVGFEARRSCLCFRRVGA